MYSRTKKTGKGIDWKNIYDSIQPAIVLSISISAREEN